MSPRSALALLAAFCVVAFAGLGILKRGLEPTLVERCRDRGGSWDRATRRCDTEPAGVRSRYVAIERPRRARCDTLAGEVRPGETFERVFGDGLRFRLRPATNAPPNPEGWTLEVAGDAGGEREYSWVATPPYRSDNPRYLDTSYAKSARQAVARDVREFGYVTGPEAHDALAGMVDTLLWTPEDLEPASRDSVVARWEAALARAGRGVLRITGTDVVDPGPGHPRGRIDRLAFTVELCPGAPNAGGGGPTS